VIARDLVEKFRNLGAADVSEPVVLGARFDVAVAALDVAQAAGVDPQCAQSVQWNLRTPFSGRGPVWVTELLLPRLERDVDHGGMPCKRWLVPSVTLRSKPCCITSL